MTVAGEASGLVLSLSSLASCTTVFLDREIPSRCWKGKKYFRES